MNLSNALAGVFEPKQQIEKDRQRFSKRDLFRLILPILVEQLLTLMVGIADTLMVSYAGDAAVSGVSLVNQLNNVFIFIFGAVASGQPVCGPGRPGERDFHRWSAAHDHCPYFPDLGHGFHPVSECAAPRALWPGRTGGDGGLHDLPGDLRPFFSRPGGL